MDQHKQQPQLTESQSAVWLKGGNKILVVDDDHVNLILLKKILSSVGGHVEGVAHGDEAIERIQKDHFDLVLMDIQMPVMDGFDTTRRLRELGFKGVIVALSASVNKDDVDSCMKVGMNDYIQKPFHKPQLVELLKKWLSK